MTLKECRIKFPIGSKVRRFRSEYEDMNTGDEDIVIGYDEDCTSCTAIHLGFYGKDHNPDNFELIEEQELQINLW